MAGQPVSSFVFCFCFFSFIIANKKENNKTKVNIDTSWTRCVIPTERLAHAEENKLFFFSFLFLILRNQFHHMTGLLYILFHLVLSLCIFILKL